MSGFRDLWQEELDKIDSAKIDTLHKFRKYVDLINKRSLMPCKNVFLTAEEIIELEKEYNLHKRVPICLLKLYGVDIHDFEPDLYTFLHEEESISTEEFMFTKRVFTHHYADISLKSSAKKERDIPREIEAFYRITKGEIVCATDVTVNLTDKLITARSVALDISEEFLQEIEPSPVPPPNSIPEDDIPVKLSEGEILQKPDWMSDEFAKEFMKGGFGEIYKSELKTELATLSWKEKIGSGAVVKVIKVLDTVYKPGTHIVNEGVREATIELIKSHNSSIFILDVSNCFAFATHAKRNRSLIVGECDIPAYQNTILPTLEQALEEMSNR